MPEINTVKARALALLSNMTLTQPLKFRPQVWRKFDRIGLQLFRHLINVRFREAPNPPRTATPGAFETV